MHHSASLLTPSRTYPAHSQAEAFQGLAEDLEEEFDDQRKRAEAENERAENERQRSEEERKRSGETERDLAVVRAQSRKALTDHEYTMGRKTREVDMLKTDLREITLRTAARALNRMQKYSTWRAFAKMKALVNIRKAIEVEGRETATAAAKLRVIELTQAKQNVEMELARLKEEQGGFQEREKNMLNIISWLLDLHSSDEEEEQHNQAFLKELRSVYETAKMEVAEMV